MLSKNRYDVMYKNLCNALRLKYTIMYYGFHLGNKIRNSPQKNIIDGKIRKKYTIQTYGCFSPKIRHIIININSEKPKSNKKQYLIENKLFDSKSENKYIKKN